MRAFTLWKLAVEVVIHLFRHHRQTVHLGQRRRPPVRCRGNAFVRCIPACRYLLWPSAEQVTSIDPTGKTAEISWIYPLLITNIHSYGKWQFIVDLPIEHGDLP